MVCLVSSQRCLADFTFLVLNIRDLDLGRRRAGNMCVGEEGRCRREEVVVFIEAKNS
jgi:hypothetical protein